MRTAYLALVLAAGCCPPRKVLPPPEPPPAQARPQPPPAAPAAAPPAPAPRDERTVVLEGTPEVPDELKRRMEQYLAARRATFQDLDERGERVLVTTDFGSTPQVHVVSAPLGARRQLTFGQEPVSNVQFVPRAERVVSYVSDVGGNEQKQIYRLDLATGRTTLLTDGKSRNESYAWSWDGQRLAFKSNARNGKDMDLWIGNGVSPNANRLLREVSGDFTPLEFSRDGKQLLVLEYLSIERSRLHLVEVATGKMAAVTPEGEHAAYRAATFSADGGSLFVTSDREGDFVELYRLDLASKRFEPLSRDLRWNVSGLDLSVDGKTLAFVVNEGGIDRLHLLDTRRGRHERVKAVPDGVIGGVRFARGAARLGIGLESATRSADAYVYDLKKKALTRWTESEIGGLDEKAFVAPALIKVKSFDGLEVPGFYYNKRKLHRAPVLIIIHGGPEAQATPYFSALVQYLAVELGLAVITPNVRGSDGYGKSYLKLDNGMLRENSVKDIGAFLDWIKLQPELDASNVGVYGGSYGGYMVLASLVHYGDRIVAGADNVGISNFVSFLENTKDYRRDLRRVEYGDERDPAMRKFLQDISPLNQAGKIRSALFVLQGLNDPRVPASEAEQIVKAARAAGKDVWYMLARNEGHGFRKRENRNLSSWLLVLFFQKHLLGTGP